MATIDDLNLTPYQRIMLRMTPAMNPYTGADVAIGGYDPALYRRMIGSGLIGAGGGGMGGGGGGGGGGDSGGGLPSGPIAPTTPEEFAAQSARNQQINDFLTNISKFNLTGLLTSGLVGLLGGKPQSPAPVEDAISTFITPEARYGFIAEQPGSTAPSPEARYGFIAEQPGSTAPSPEAQYGFVAEQPGSLPPSPEAQYGFVAEQPGSLPPSPEAQYGFVAEQPGSPAPDTGGGGDSPGGGDFGGSGYDGGMFSGAQSGDVGFAMGGLVNSVGGSDPAGPDEGQINIMRGEYVIKKSAVNKYGKGLLDMINDGKIPAKKMKSLLG